MRVVLIQRCGEWVGRRVVVDYHTASLLLNHQLAELVPERKPPQLERATLPQPETPERGTR